MTITTRPSVVPFWTTGQSTQIAQPTPSLQASGFTAGQRPAFQTMNWLLYQLGQWVQYLDANANGQLSGLEIGNTMRLLGGGVWSYSATSGTLAWSEPFALSTPSIADADNTVAAGSVSIQPGQVAYVIANLPFATTGNTQSGSTSLTQLPYELGIVTGQVVTGAGIPANTTVTAIADGQVTISNAATATASNVGLTFAGTGTLSVQSSSVTSVMPSPNLIVIAACTPTSVTLGVNSGQMRLVDGEAKRLLGTGFIHVPTAIAGQQLAAGQVIYLSPGGGNDTDTIQATTTSGSTTLTAVSSTALIVPGQLILGAGIANGTTVTAIGTSSLSLSTAATASASGVSLQTQRIAGGAYLADASSFNGFIRGNIAGIVTSAAILSQTAATSIRYMTAGVYANCSNLLPGFIYYQDPTKPGAITANTPSTAVYTSPVGIATSATSLYVQTLPMARPATADSVFNDVTLSPITGSTNAVGLRIAGSSGYAFTADSLGNLNSVGNLTLAGTAAISGVLNTYANIICNTGSITAPSFVSAAGFKTIGPTAYYWGNGQSSSANYVAMNVAVVANIGTQTASYAPMVWQSPRAGSITALSVAFNVNNTQNFVFRLNINGTATSQLISTTGNASVTFPKGTYAFGANQAISIQIGASGSPSCVVTANFEVEMGA